MLLLDRYIARTVAITSLIVLIVLVSIDLAFAFVSELSSVGNGNYGFEHAMLYLGLTLPRRCYTLFPIAVLLGSLVGLGTLASNSELVVLRAAGISNRRIVRSVVQAGLILSLLTLAIGEWAAPIGEQKAQRMRAELVAGKVSLLGKDGLWIRDQDRFINIQELLPGQHVKDITIYAFDEGGLRTATHAARGWYADGSWTLQQVEHTDVNRDRVDGRRVATEVWTKLIDPGLFDVLLVAPDSLSVVALSRYVEHLTSNNLDANRYELAFWRKLAAPLITLIMVMMALPLVFGSNRHVGAGQRMLIGSLIGIVYFLVDRLIAHIGLIYFALPPLISAFLPPLMFAAVLAWIMRTRV